MSSSNGKLSALHPEDRLSWLNTSTRTPFSFGMINMTRIRGTLVPIKLCVLCLVAGVASPALADHAGPTGIGAGTSLNVLSPDTLERGDASVGFRLTYTRPEQRSDEELENLAGQHIHAHNTDYSIRAVAGVAYGITDRLTVSAELPYVRHDDLREGEHSHAGGQALNEVVQLGSVSGLGDLSVIAKYKLIDREGAKFALLSGLKMPTASTHKRTSEGERLETEHQPGTGSWDPIVGAAFGAELGSLNFSASALYQFSGKGAQDTRLGDRAQGGIALSRHFGPGEHHHDVSEHHHDDPDGHQHEGTEAPEHHDHSSWDAFIELTGEWEGRQKVAGQIEEASGGKSVWVSPGARFNSATGFSVAASLGLPVWEDIRESHPDNDYRLTLSVGHAF